MVTFVELYSEKYAEEHPTAVAPKVVKAMYNAGKFESDTYSKNGSCGYSTYNGDYIYSSSSYGYYGRIIVPLSYSQDGISYFLSSIPLSTSISTDSYQAWICSSAASFEVRTLVGFEGDTFVMHDSHEDDSILDYISSGVTTVSTGNTSGIHTYNLFEAGNVPTDANYVEVIYDISGSVHGDGKTPSYASASSGISFSFTYLALDLN